MKGNRSLLLIPLVIGGYILSSCGGSSRGLSADVSTFNTVVVYVTSASPNPLESDLLQKTERTVNVKKRKDNAAYQGDTNGNGICDDGETDCIPCAQVPFTANNYQERCCLELKEVSLCIGGGVRSDSVNFTFRSEVIRNAAGQPVTNNPSPVQIRGYRLSFGGMCIPGEYIYPLGDVIPPGGELTVPVQVVSVDMKSRALSSTTYEYVNPEDGCRTTFNVPAYSGICSTYAIIDFQFLELYSGLTRNYTYILPVRFGDFESEGECRR
ncbi:MAG: hypothetical protein QXO48_02990 [Desulfurococcaceae archaeon]